MKSYDFMVMLAKRDGLTANAKWIAALLYHYAGDKGFTNAGHGQLMAESGLSRRQVQCAIELLREHGIVKAYRCGHKAGFGRPAMVSSFTIGWPDKAESTHATDTLGHATDALSASPTCPSKGSIKDRAANTAPLKKKAEPSSGMVDASTMEADKLRELHRLWIEELAKHGLPANEETVQDWIDLLIEATSNGHPNGETLKLLQSERARSTGHARGILKLRGFINV